MPNLLIHWCQHFHDQQSILWEKHILNSLTLNFPWGSCQLAWEVSFISPFMPMTLLPTITSIFICLNQAVECESSPHKLMNMWHEKSLHTKKIWEYLMVAIQSFDVGATNRPIVWKQRRRMTRWMKSNINRCTDFLIHSCVHFDFPYGIYISIP